MISSNEDGLSPILYRRWDAPSPKAILLLIHGLGGHTGRWEFLADFFLKNNIPSYALELRGFGETKDLKGHIDSFNIYFDDIRRLSNIIRKENPSKKVFLVGESMGAVISFLMAIHESVPFSGLICISPAFRSRLKFTPLEYVKIFLSVLYNPKRQFYMPFNSDMCTRDTSYQKKMDSDGREHRLATSKLLFEMAIAQVLAPLLKEKLNMPTMFLLAGEDRLVDPRASKNIFKGLKAKDRTIIDYPGMYHALSIEKGRETVFEDILKWLEARI